MLVPILTCFSARLLVSALLLPLAAFAAANAEFGEKLYTSRCGACHSIDDNGAGPRHRSLFGCRAGTQQDYDYSAPLRKSGIVWNEVTLDRWLANPNTLVPGNKMVVQLANVPKDRADLIAYLKAATAGGKSVCKHPSAVPAPAKTDK